MKEKVDSAFSVLIFFSVIFSYQCYQNLEPKVYLTVSSLVESSILKDPELRKVILNYYDVECFRMLISHSFVALYDHDPVKDPKNPLFLYKPSNCPEGRIETNYSFPYHKFTTKDLRGSNCLGFWGAYFESGKIVHSSCIKTQPNWMEKMKKVIGSMSFRCLMIPGTHNSGLYLQYSRFQDTPFQRYMYTQEEPIFNQLVYGIRYLDLRVWHEGAQKWKSKMQITHDKIHLGLPLLQDILNDVKKFVSKTKEFVIVDFHRLLSGFFMTRTLEDWQHRDIINLVRQTFGNLIIESDYSDLPLERLWEMDKRVLVSYRDELKSPEDNWVTYPVFHWWEEAENIKDLHEFLVKNACSVPFYPTAAVAVLTPSMWTPLVDATYSRRKTADKVNIQVDKWFRNELFCSNVVLTDYFLGNNIIEIAMEANKNASRCNISVPGYW